MTFGNNKVRRWLSSQAKIRLGWWKPLILAWPLSGCGGGIHCVWPLQSLIVRLPFSARL
jgi:hypothetical protein